jgi:hypothetical protein
MVLTAERLRALRLISRCPNGCTAAILLAHGFSIGMLAELVFNRLAATRVEPAADPRRSGGLIDRKRQRVRRHLGVARPNLGGRCDNLLRKATHLTLAIPGSFCPRSAHK